MERSSKRMEERDRKIPANACLCKLTENRVRLISQTKHGKD